MPSVLIVDTDRETVRAFRACLPEGERRHPGQPHGPRGDRGRSPASARRCGPGYALPDVSGLEVFRQIRQLDARIPVILMTTEAQRGRRSRPSPGALECVVKPLEGQDLRVGLAACKVRHLLQPPAGTAGPARRVGADGLVGRCPAMQEVYKAIGRVAPQDVTVLILGESGTGKELVARAIHQHSRRAERPFLAINCAAIPETLLESELFGHEKGAFTGADRKPRRQVRAVPRRHPLPRRDRRHDAATQSKILRVLQDQRFERVGGNETIQTDVRIIAATNHDLEAMVGDGQFRADLYYRLNVFTIALPPLRERRRRSAIAGRPFPRRSRAGIGQAARKIVARGDGCARRLPLAGERAGTAERVEAGGAPGQLAAALARRSADRREDQAVLCRGPGELRSTGVCTPARRPCMPRPWITWSGWC